MVSMVMRHQNSVGMANPFAQKLLAKIGPGIDENATSRGGDESAGAGSMKFGVA
jgi:hypothetical protein